tara:strand:- start:98 stop:319 length:222 start_codon:yes stop_codon:yes gene_type:complete
MDVPSHTNRKSHLAEYDHAARAKHGNARAVEMDVRRGKVEMTLLAIALLRRIHLTGAGQNITLSLTPFISNHP